MSQRIRILDLVQEYIPDYETAKQAAIELMDMLMEEQEYLPSRNEPATQSLEGLNRKENLRKPLDQGN